MGKLLDRLEKLLIGYTADERADITRRYIDWRADQRATAAYQAMVDDLEAHFDEDVAAERTMSDAAQEDEAHRA